MKHKHFQEGTPCEGEGHIVCSKLARGKGNHEAAFCREKRDRLEPRKGTFLVEKEGVVCIQCRAENSPALYWEKVQGGQARAGIVSFSESEERRGKKKKRCPRVNDCKRKNTAIIVKLTCTLGGSIPSPKKKKNSAAKEKSRHLSFSREKGAWPRRQQCGPRSFVSRSEGKGESSCFALGEREGTSATSGRRGRGKTSRVPREKDGLPSA